MAPIGLIATFPEMAKTAREVAKEIKVDLVAVEATQEHSGEAARRLVREHEVEAIISRGPTAAVIRQYVDVPVNCCNPTALDMMLALNNARAHGRRVGLIPFYELEFDPRPLQGVLGVELLVSPICRTLAEVRRAVAWAAGLGAEVLVGGANTMQAGTSAGLPSILLETGPETVRMAIRRARELAEVRRQELVRVRQMQAIVDLVSDGILATDRQGRIQVMNNSAARMLGVPVSQARQQHVDTVAPALRVGEALASPKQEVGALRKVGDVTLATNLVPVMVDDAVTGVVATFQDVTQIQNLEIKIRRQLHRKGLVAKFRFDDLVGVSESWRKLIVQAKSYAGTDSTVLLVGETGTGKEMVAQSIHNASARSNGPFVAVNCGALPENLLESELFGYEEGAFTGARRGGKAGLFELAHGGTIFLDEINAASLTLQTHLLRVLQEREVMRVGGDRVIPLDLRVVVATNEPLPTLVAARQFRADLYYRLNVLKLDLPPLRNRPADIPVLFRHFAAQFAAPMAGGTAEVPPRLLRRLKEHRWPGNIRELENVAKKFVLLRSHLPAAELEEMLIADLDESEAVQPGRAPEAGVDLAPGDLLRRLAACGGNRTRLAAELGISRTTLWKLLKQNEVGVEA